MQRMDKETFARELVLTVKSLRFLVHDIAGALEAGDFVRAGAGFMVLGKLSTDYVAPSAANIVANQDTYRW